MARPKIKIDYDIVEKLANIQCTQEEIASFLEVSVRTLQRDEEFCRLYKKGQDSGKMSLRRYQFKQAEKNASMAIFLGKQYLGQKDIVETDNSKELSKVEELLSKIEKEANNDTK
jgi:hypothetical protein